MGRQRRLRAHGLARAGLRIAGVLGLLVMSGITVQARAEQAERQAFPPPGQLIDIGGGSLIHLRQWQPTMDGGGPTVVLDVSAAMPLSEWAWIGQGLAEAGHRVVAYDRPGMGWSRGPWQPRDAGHAADALAKVLTTAGISPPYVVVAHSYGGFSARVFAGRYKPAVAGLVLLDTTHPDGGGALSFATFYRTRAWQAHAGLFQLVPQTDWFATLPEEERDAANAVSLWASHLDTSAEELEAWDTSVAQVKEVYDLGDMPVLVVAGVGSDAQIAQQRDLLRVSSESRMVQLNVNHMGMLVSKPEADLVLGAIGEFLATIPN